MTLVVHQLWFIKSIHNGQSHLLLFLAWTDPLWGVLLMTWEIQALMFCCSHPEILYNILKQTLERRDLS
mgnify:CR=1 FL=1